MPRVSANHITALLKKSVNPLRGAEKDYDPLMDLIGEARIVLLGKRLMARTNSIERGDHHAPAHSGERVYCGRRGRLSLAGCVPRESLCARTEQRSERSQLLADFKRFPTWMWRNRDVLDFVTWLRAHNESQSGDAVAAGFYGLDLYSLHASMRAVLGVSRWNRSGICSARPFTICLLRSLWGRYSALWICGWHRINEDLRRRRHRSTTGSASPRRELSPPRRIRGRRRILFCRTECSIGEERRAVLSIYVSGPCVLIGICVINIWRRP